MRALLLVLVLAANAAAADPVPPPPAAPVLPAPPAPTGDLKKLQGFWKPESIRHAGADQMPDAKARSLITLVVKDAEYRLYVAKDAAADKHIRLATADVVLNEADKSFTLGMKGGARKGVKLHGVYDLSAGKLRLCYGPADKPRPTAFDSPKGADVFLEVWTPEKK